MDKEELKQAIILTNEGKYQEAENIYLRLYDNNSNDPYLLSVIGLFYINLNDYDNGVKFLKKACDIKETFGTVASLGFAEYERKNFVQAAIILEHALELGKNEDIYNKLILSLFETYNYKKAIEYTNKMCELYPNNPKSIANKVKALTKEGKLQDAEQYCINYLKQNPKEGLLWYHLGLLKELIYLDDNLAIECYKAAGQFGYSGADYNIGVAYQKLGNYTEAENYYKKFLNAKPNSDECRIALGLCNLAQKKFKEGYRILYNRIKGHINKYTNNLWKPETSLAQNIVVIGDQGFGDNIQFVRYLPFLKDHNITLAVSEHLIKLFQKNYPWVKCISKDEINPEEQAVRITDLAYALDMDFDNIPYSSGYLNAERMEIDCKKPKIGLCWEAGSAGIRGMINRTIPVQFFEPILNLQNIQTYSFQYTDTFNGNETYSQMINLAKDFKDFYDTASALKSMDAVVTVDTCIAHLSGALGIKTYLLLPYASDWRWFNDTKTTTWYGSVTIYKQEEPGNWIDSINDIKQILSSM